MQLKVSIAMEESVGIRHAVPKGQDDRAALYSVTRLDTHLNDIGTYINSSAL
jgi:hypothetical protein